MKFVNPLKWPLYLQTLAAMIVGIAFGFAERQWFNKSPDNFFLADLREISGFIIGIIRYLAIPLLFFAIFDSVLRAELGGRAIARMLGIVLINSTCAMLIGLTMSNVLQLGKLMPVSAKMKDEFWALSEKAQTASTQTAIFLFFTSPMILAIGLSILIGAAIVMLSRYQPEFWTSKLEAVKRFSHACLKFMLRVFELMILLIPLVVFCAVAPSVAEHGNDIFVGLAGYLALCIGGMILHVVLVYQTWVWAVAKMPLGKFWRVTKEPATYAFGINSSLATLQVTLASLEKLEVSPEAARLSACVGTNLNNDGILLYEVAAVLFMSQAFGLEMSIGQQFVTAIVCIVATMGVGGIPEAGVIALTLVMGTAGLPPKSVMLLMPVDWVVARCRSATNAIGDIAVAIAIDATGPPKSAKVEQESISSNPA